jgi:hypothetical protein
VPSLHFTQIDVRFTLARVTLPREVRRGEEYGIGRVRGSSASERARQ